MKLGESVKTSMVQSLASRLRKRLRYAVIFPKKDGADAFIEQGEIYVKFDSIESAQKAIQSLNGRFFGGRSVSAAFISNALFQAHQ